MARTTKSTTLVEEPREIEPTRGSAGVMVLVGKRAITCRLHDLSVDGARLQSPLPLQIGQRISIVLEAASIGTSTLTADVIAVHSADLANDLVEVRFVAESQLSESALSEFASAHGAERSDAEDDPLDHQVTMPIPLVLPASEVDAPTLVKPKPK